MSERFRVIHPGDMSKLERIVELLDQNAKDFAQMTADAIREPVARATAEILVGRSPVDPDYSEFIKEIRDRVHAFNRKLAAAPVPA